MADGGDGLDLAGADTASAGLPDYLERHYRWAYLRPASLRVFDRTAMASAILWGQYRRLTDAALAEIAPGDRVLQVACVYGDLSQRLAARLGPHGALDVIDIAPIQVANTARKLRRFSNARVHQADAAGPGALGHGVAYDAVLVFFLLHELPPAHKRRTVDAALARVAPGGRAIFVDYARPAAWNPLRPVMGTVFRLLEPFAAEMWHTPILSLASAPGHFRWRERRCLGGLYQVVVAERPRNLSRRAASSG